MGWAGGLGISNIKGYDWLLTGKSPRTSARQSVTRRELQARSFGVAVSFRLIFKEVATFFGEWGRGGESLRVEGNARQSKGEGLGLGCQGGGALRRDEKAGRIRIGSTDTKERV